MNGVDRRGIQRVARLVACVAIAAAVVIVGIVLPDSAGASSRRLPAPTSLWVGGTTPFSATISWTPVRGATAYDVYRSGRFVRRVKATTFLDKPLSSASWFTYTVTPRIGRIAGTRSDVLPVVTLAPLSCTHWVSSTGSDRNGGTSAAHPWRTLQHLVNAWQPGWVGCVSGSFVEDVTIGRGGTATRKVVLRSVPGAARASLRGRIAISKGADYVVVQDMNLDGRALTGPSKDDLPSPTINGNHDVFLRNDVFNKRTRICFIVGSIRGWGRAVGTVIAGNRIHDCGERDAHGDGFNHHHGIYVEGADVTRIVYNTIFQNADRGIQLYPDAQRSYIARNVLDGNGEGLIYSGAEGRASSHNRVERNVVTNSRTRYDIEYYWENPRAPGRGNVAVRNCVGGGKEGAITIPAVGFATAYNVLGNPQYANRLAGDFHLLTARSACANWMRSVVVPLRPWS